MQRHSPHSFGRSAAAANLIIALIVFALAAGSVRGQVTTSLYFTNRDGEVVKAIDSAGGSSTFLSNGSVLPPALFGVTLDTAGNLYVAVSPNNAGDRIVKITPGGVASVFFAFNQTTSPTDLAFDSAGNLYVGSQAGRGILKITPGGSLSTFAAQSSLINRPFGLAFGDDGDLYVSNYGAQNIVRFDTSGTGSVFKTLPAASNPFGIDFDNAGNLLVVRSNANTVDSITPGGVETTIASSISNGSGLTFDPTTGYAYVITDGFQIYKIAADGSSTTLFSTVSGIGGQSYGLENVNLYASAVPEPSTYAAFAGLLAGAVALYARRRERSRAATSV